MSRFFMYRKWGKRFLDVLVSCTCLILFSPVFLLIALAIIADSPGRVFFRQLRVGYQKGVFEIIKFRTMKTDVPKYIPGYLLHDSDVFITPCGKFLRRSGKFLRRASLDEIPQLINIIKGQMS